MSQGEVVPDDVSPAELRREANLRAHKAGYDVTRDGKPMPRKIQTTVPCGEVKLNLWPRDAAGHLIE